MNNEEVVKIHLKHSYCYPLQSMSNTILDLKVEIEEREEREGRGRKFPREIPGCSTRKLSNEFEAQLLLSVADNE